MTENEAIKWQKSFKETYKGFPKDIDAACDMAINALEKQIPKKPKTDDRYVMYICPCCNDFIKVSQNYCPNCGQAIDWSDTD